MGICVDDGYSSQDCAITTVNVLDNTPITPTNLQNTTGVFWINWTWKVSAGNIDDYDTQINGSSVGEHITNLYYSTYSAYDIRTISVRGLLGFVSDTKGLSVPNTTIKLGTLQTITTEFRYYKIQNITTRIYNFSVSAPGLKPYEDHILMTQDREYNIGMMTGATNTSLPASESTNPGSDSISLLRDPSTQLFFVGMLGLMVIVIVFGDTKTSTIFSQLPQAFAPSSLKT